MDTEYITRKLFQCKELVENSTSEEQKKIYQGYLEFWQEKAKNIKIHSKIPIKKSIKEPLKKAEKPEPAAVVIPDPEVDTIGMSIQNGLLHQTPIEEEVVPEPEEVIEEPQWTAEEELLRAEEFEAKYPNKHAYLRRNGKLSRTKAFEEFLNQSTVE